MPKRSSSVRLADAAALVGTGAMVGGGEWSGHPMAGFVVAAVVALGQVAVRLVPVAVTSLVAMSSMDVDTKERIIEAMTKLLAALR